MITDLDETLKQILIQKGAIDPAEVDFNFETPDREWSATISKPTINLYLYDIRENHELRGTEWLIEKDRNGISTRKKNPNRIDLSYLITVWTNDIDDEHRLLWHVLLTLFRFPEIPPELLSGQLAQQSCPILMSAAQPDGLYNNPSDFWTALDNEIKPSIYCVVTMPLDIALAFTAPPVKTKLLKFQAPDTDQEGFAQISGLVHETGQPEQGIAGATVVAREARMTARTNDEGLYTFTRLPLGEHTFQITIPGRKAKETKVTIPAASYDLEA
jgi:hypothetical protein